MPDLKQLVRPIAMSLALACALPAHAGPASDALSACLADKVSDKDRVALARWLYSAMSAHPGLGEEAKITAAEREADNRAVGTLFTRLVSTDCASLFKKSYDTEGEAGSNAAFAQLGRIALQEIMSSPEVQKASGGFQAFVDHKALAMAIGK